MLYFSWSITGSYDHSITLAKRMSKRWMQNSFSWGHYCSRNGGAWLDSRIATWSLFGYFGYGNSLPFHCPRSAQNPELKSWGCLWQEVIKKMGTNVVPSLTRNSVWTCGNINTVSRVFSWIETTKTWLLHMLQEMNRKSSHVHQWKKRRSLFLNSGK